MLKLAELSGRELKWIQPSAVKMEYELHDGDQLAATLRFRSSWGTFATGESADGCWTFKRVGFWETKATVRACGAENDLAVFKNNTWKGGGTLQFPDGRNYLASTNFWATKYDFKTNTGEELITYQKIGGMLHVSALVTIQPPAVPIPETPWMVLMGWYLALMMLRDASAAVAAT